MSQIQIGQWGNGAGIRIHTDVLKTLGCNVGSCVDVNVVDGVLIIKPVVTLDQLIAFSDGKWDRDGEDSMWLNDGRMGVEEI